MRHHIFSERSYVFRQVLRLPCHLFFEGNRYFCLTLSFPLLTVCRDLFDERQYKKNAFAMENDESHDENEAFHFSLTKYKEHSPLYTGISSLIRIGDLYFARFAKKKNQNNNKQTNKKKQNISRPHVSINYADLCETSRAKIQTDLDCWFNKSPGIVTVWWPMIEAFVVEFRCRHIFFTRGVSTRNLKVHLDNAFDRANHMEGGFIISKLRGFRSCREFVLSRAQIATIFHS